MTYDTPKYTPDIDSPPASELTMSSTEPIFTEGRSAYWRSIWALAMASSIPHQTISTRGISGNAHIVNIGGDNITHNNDEFGAETYAVLESIEERLKISQEKALDDRINGWLSAPDVSQNLNAALRRRQPGTGTWFLDGAYFAEWKENPDTVLCIYGAPGCGKTVLCASIIEAVQDSCQTRLLSGWAYFFFDNRNANKGLQLYENFLRSILSQLCSRWFGIPRAVTTMYQTHGSGREQPSVKALAETLRQVIDAFEDVYIMVDSLDESGDRNELLKWIEAVSRWNSARCHLLTTSRSEPDIASHLERIPNMRIIYLQGAALDKDISIFLDERLSLVSRWRAPIRVLIKNTLFEGANGMFRWVAMQMDSLEHCLNVRAVREKLNALPRDLEETYAQILAGSPHQQDLLLMLHWLAFSARALELEEIAEVPSVDFGAAGGPCYDPDLKYSNPSIALTVCSGLVTVTDGTVKLAHFSVKEYLISDRIKNGTAAHFAMNLGLSHSVIAQTYVAYLLFFNRSDSIDLRGGTISHFPLHLYAAENLVEHLRLSKNTDCPTLQEMLLKLFIPTPRYESALVNWVEMHNFDKNGWAEDEMASPLYYASFLGLRDVVESLLKHDADVDLHGGSYDTALQAAAAKGHKETAKLLLERGANANLQGGQGGGALPAAAYGGHDSIVKMLLENGADVNFRGGQYGTALQVAASGGHTGIVKILLESGADVNLQGGEYGTPLQAAAANGDTEIVKLLLEHGTDPNIERAFDGTALYAAASRGYTDIVKVILEHGADANIQGGRYGTALQAAAANGKSEIVKLLLEHGADPDIERGFDGTALYAASSKGHTGIVKMILAHGADVNIQGGRYWTAFHATANESRAGIVKMLFEHGSNVSIQGGRYGTALQAAAANGDTEIVKLLLEHGVDPNIEGGFDGTALHATAYTGHTEAAKLLLQGGADVYIRSGVSARTALQVAEAEGHADMHRLLIQWQGMIDSNASCGSEGGNCEL